MAANGAEQSTVGERAEREVPRKHVLIEASKLADRRMDGIKRYVVELLLEFSRLNKGGAGIDLDIMIHGKVYPLADLPRGALSRMDPEAPGRN